MIEFIAGAVCMMAVAISAPMAFQFMKDKAVAMWKRVTGKV